MKIIRSASVVVDNGSGGLRGLFEYCIFHIRVQIPHYKCQMLLYFLPQTRRRSNIGILKIIVMRKEIRKTKRKYSERTLYYLYLKIKREISD